MGVPAVKNHNKYTLSTNISLHKISEELKYSHKIQMALLKRVLRTMSFILHLHNVSSSSEVDSDIMLGEKEKRRG